MIKSVWSLVLLISVSLNFAIAQQPDANPQQGASPNRALSPGQLQDCQNAGLSETACQESTGNPATQQNAEQLIPPVRTPQILNPIPELQTSGVQTGNSYRNQPRKPSLPPRPETEFEQMVADSVGRALPVFGQSLFTQPPSTFAPTDRVQVPSDYVIGPQDELQIRIWGQLDADLRVTVDRSGEIYVPHVGTIAIAGVSYKDLSEYLKRAVSKFFRNFDLVVSLGRLRSIQILVVGQAQAPGTYTISSLSTLVNAIFACGGVSPQGSLRNIEVRRDGKIISTFDFYDLLIKGDKSKDVRLQSGDVIYIPHVGPLVAVSGSVNAPAIYEARDGMMLSDLIDIAGGLSSVADTGKVVIERIEDHQARKVLEFPLVGDGKNFQIKDGDIVRVFSIVPRFEDAVTLRGSVTNPGRYPWNPGMRIRDLIPNASALLTRSYWLNRASISDGRATEYPLAKTPKSPASGSYRPGTTSTDRYPATVSGRSDIEDSSPLSSRQDLEETSRSRNEKEPGSTIFTRQQITGETLTTDLRRYAPEINWHYATVQRVNPTDLSTKLLAFDLQKAVLKGDENENIELQPGDIVTIFSQTDIGIPQDERSRYVIVEGEVIRPGVYKVAPGETLPALLERAGGLSPKAYVYGTQLTRESARIEQQKSIDELVRTLELQVGQSQGATGAGGATDPQAVAAMQAFQQSLIAQARRFEATGRVVLNIKPNVNSISAIPAVQMEDNDKIVIPHEPSTVSVVGYVYNPGSFLFDLRGEVGRYLKLAGNTRPRADMKHAFVLRANGTVVARTSVNGLFSGDQFSSLRLHPGDEIVVPSKIETGAWVRGLRDWTQIASQLALTAASLAVVR